MSEKALPPPPTLNPSLWTRNENRGNLQQDDAFHDWNALPTIDRCPVHDSFADLSEKVEARLRELPATPMGQQ